MGKAQTLTQISSGGVAFRSHAGRIEIALIHTMMSGKDRWQLPKGIVEIDEPAEDAALREVREETNLSTISLGLIDTVEYWYYATRMHATRNGEHVRYHKFVHFYLLKYQSGEIQGQAGEVNEARWVEITEAIPMLAFESERKIAQTAQQLILELGA